MKRVSAELSSTCGRRAGVFVLQRVVLGALAALLVAASPAGA